MITAWFLELPYYFLAFVIGLLPASEGLPASVVQAATLIGSQIGIFEPIMPLATLGTVLGILFSAEIGVWSWKSFKWIASHIPFVGGRG